MHDQLWLYLYMAAISDSNKYRNEIFEVINNLLPWLNYELWSATKKKEEEGRKNITYEQQVAEAMKGNYDSQVNLDEIVLGSNIDASQHSTEFKQPVQNQPTGRIKDLLFPNQ